MTHDPEWLLMIAALCNGALGVWNVMRWEPHTVFLALLNFITAAVCAAMLFKRKSKAKEKEPKNERGN